MRINSIQKNIIFERRFTKREEKRVNKLHPQVQTILNHTGHNILIIHDPCLPAAPGQDTGIGYLFSKEGLKYLKEMKSLIGITMVEVHPQGEYRISSKNGFFINRAYYSKSPTSVFLAVPTGIFQPKHTRFCFKTSYFMPENIESGVIKQCIFCISSPNFGR